MYAATGGNDVWIAVIGVVGALGAVAIPAWLNSRKTKNAIGVPNGRGTVVEMNQDQLTLLEAIKEGQFVNREHLQVMDSKLDAQDKKLDAHSLIDTKRFRAIHNHLNIPFEEDPT